MDIGQATASSQTATLSTPAGWRRYVHQKHHIGPVGLSVLGLLACVPIFMILARLSAYPDMTLWALPGVDSLQQFGVWLNQSLTLAWVPPADRWTILYLLLLPSAALLITVARLTFGLRILSFRSILIAVGFQEIGIIPSLVLMAVVVATVVLVRPTMRRIRLPLYARVAVIMCVAVGIMVGALFVGPWLRSEIIWNVAFFPVIILAMLAEGIAKTMDRDNSVTAAWRASWTVVVALMIAGFSQIPAVREFMLHFPEIMITQLAAIVFVSEFLDFRLWQDVPAALHRRFNKGEHSEPRQARIAVVRNRWNTGVIGRLGVPAAAKGRTQSIQPVIDVLRDAGFTVEVFEGDMALLRALREFIPPDPRSGAPGGIVLNLATGIQGAGRYAHVPALLELAGIAYTGPDPIAQARLSDRYLLLSLLRQARVATAPFRLMSSGYCDVGSLRFPLTVRPRCEPDSGAVRVRNKQELERAIRHVEQRYGQPALIEEILEGCEIRVAILGNDRLECLPLLQTDTSGNGKLCPAPIDARLAERIREYAQRAYIASGCRDYARIDVRLTPGGDPCVHQIQTHGIFARRGSVARAAHVAGYPFAALMQRIIEISWRRYGGSDHVKQQPLKQADTDKPPTQILSNGRVAAR